MFGANAIWGVMSPIAKFVMISGTITPWVVTNLRIAGAMILFLARVSFHETGTCGV